MSNAAGDLLDSGSEVLNAKTFTVVAAATDIANAKSMISIVNTSSSVIARLSEVYIHNSRTAATTGIVAEFRLIRCTGHSAGTSLTPILHDTLDTLDSGITVRTGGTIAGEAASYFRRWLWSSDEWGAGTLDTEASQVSSQQLAAAYRATFKPITLRQNEGLTLKQITNSANGTFDIVLVFTQE